MDLIGREIFAVGKWNNMTFTEDDLDDIVANFEKLSVVHKVPLKFGHNDEQPITDGQPAIGWVSRVFREGKKLYADFVDMPKTVFEAVKNKLYRTVSVELLFDVDHQGNRFSHVLDAVALLGADQPAVNTLADLDALLAARTSFAGGRRICFETIAGKKQESISIEKEELEMDEKQLKQFIADAVEPLKQELEKVTFERDELRLKTEQADRERAEFEAEQKRQKITAARQSINDVLDEAVRDKRMTPAMREIYTAQIGVNSDDRVVDIDIEQVKAMCSAVNVSPIGASAMTAKTPEYGERNFARALEAVARANPDLHKAYLENGEVN